MIYYTELIKNNKKDTVQFGPIDGNEPLINTAKTLLEELGKAVLPGSPIFEKQDKPQLLHCLPQNIVELVDATLHMIDPNHEPTKKTADKFKDLLKTIKDLMQKEKCNVYIIKSEVRFLLNIYQDFS